MEQQAHNKAAHGVFNVDSSSLDQTVSLKSLGGLPTCQPSKMVRCFIAIFLFAGLSENGEEKTRPYI